MERIIVKVAISLATIWFVCSSTTTLASENKTAYPHIIVCEVNEVRHFAYLDRVEADGRAFYITPSGKGGSIAKDGVMSRSGAIAGSCSGKTLKELIASGQAHFMRN